MTQKIKHSERHSSTESKALRLGLPASGAVFLERYLVVQMRSRGPNWSAFASDLAREMGHPPSHRLELHFLKGSNRTAALRMLPARLPRPERRIKVEGGELLVERFHRPAPKVVPSSSLVLLAQLLFFAEQNHLPRPRLSLNALTWSDGQVVPWGYGYLVTARDEVSFEHCLILFETLCVGLFRHTRPQDATELLAQLYDTSPQRPLPHALPFVGRDESVQRLIAAAPPPNATSLAITSIIGPAGIGKTRLLHAFCDEYQSRTEAVCLHYTDQCPDPIPVAWLKQLKVEWTDGPLFAKLIQQAKHAFLTNDVPALTGIFSQLNNHKRPLLFSVDTQTPLDPTTSRFLQSWAYRPLSGQFYLLLCSREPLAPELKKLITSTVTLCELNQRALSTLLLQSLPGAHPQLQEDIWSLRRLSGGNPRLLWNHLNTWLSEGHYQKRAPWIPQSRSGQPKRSHVTDDRSVRPILYALIAAREKAVSLSWLVEVSGFSPPLLQQTLSDCTKAGVFLQRGHRWSLGESTIEIPRELLRSAHRCIASWLKQHPSKHDSSEIASHLERAHEAGQSEQLATLHLNAGHEALANHSLPQADWHFLRARERTRKPSKKLSATEGLGQTALAQQHIKAALLLFTEAMTFGDEQEHLELLTRVIPRLVDQNAALQATQLLDHVLNLHQKALPISARSLVSEAGRVALLRSSAPPRAQSAECKVYTQLLPHRPLSSLGAGLLLLARALSLYQSNHLAERSLLFAYLATISSSLHFSAPARWFERQALLSAQTVPNDALYGQIIGMRAYALFSNTDFEEACTQNAQAIYLLERSNQINKCVTHTLTQLRFSLFVETIDTLMALTLKAVALARVHKTTKGLLALRAMFSLLLARADHPDAVHFTLQTRDLIVSRPIGDFHEATLARTWTALAFAHLGRPDDGATLLEHPSISTGFVVQWSQYSADTHLASILCQVDLHRCRQMLRLQRFLSVRSAALWHYSELLTSPSPSNQTQAAYALITHANAHLQHHLVQTAHHFLEPLTLLHSPKNPPPQISPELFHHAGRAAPIRATSQPLSVFFRRLIRSVADTLPPRLTFQGRYIGDPLLDLPFQQLQFLLINALFAVGHALKQRGHIELIIQQLFNEDAEHHICQNTTQFQLKASGVRPLAPLIGLNLCAENIAEFGGFLEVSRPKAKELILSLQLPTQPCKERPKPVIQVIGLHSPTQQTLIHTLKSLGHRVHSTATPSAFQIQPGPLFYTNENEAHPLFPPNDWLDAGEHILPIGVFSHHYQGPLPQRFLRYPFSLEELRRLLDSLGH